MAPGPAAETPATKPGQDVPGPAEGLEGVTGEGTEGGEALADGGVDADGGGGGEPDGGPGEPDCTEDADCPEGLVCSGQNTCEEPAELPCLADRDCPDGDRPFCDPAANLCVACLDNAHCDDGLQCSSDHRCDTGDTCQFNSECDVGSICAENHCTTGCQSNLDCGEGKFCDQKAATNGVCVGCLKDADCDEGQSCLAGQCTTACEADADCGGGKCNPKTGACVECLEPADCPLGKLCSQNACVPGCDSDAGCPGGAACTNGQCEGCVDDSQCGAEEKCDTVTGQCTRGCTGTFGCGFGTGQVCDEARGLCVDCVVRNVGGQDRSIGCEGGQICDAATNTCRGCADDSECNGRVCEAGACVECRTDAECAPNNNDKYCLTAEFNCVECLDSSHCPNGSCDMQDHNCVDCQSDADCEAATPRCAEVNGDNTCVACTGDTDCGAGERCDSAEFKCIPQNQKKLCEPCTADAECGAGNLCIEVPAVDPKGTSTERACGRGCSGGGNGGCPDGWSCANGQCVPNYGGFGGQKPVSSCAALRDLMSGKSCDPAVQTEDDCGLPADDDADCIDRAGQGVCTIKCVPFADPCPNGFECQGSGSGGFQPPFYCVKP